jgi:hypothetical protein
LLRIGPLEYLRSLGDQFDELATEFQVSAFGVLVPGEVATQLLPLFLESVEPLAEEVFRDNVSLCLWKLWACCLPWLGALRR